MVEIDSSEEQDAIAEQMSSLELRHKDFWIGLHDIDQEGDWVWYISQRPVDAGFVNWAPGSPDDYEQKEDCATLININGEWNPAKWGDIPCSVREVTNIRQISMQVEHDGGFRNNI